MLWAVTPQGWPHPWGGTCHSLLPRGEVPEQAGAHTPFPVLPLIRAGPRASPTGHLMDLPPHPHLCMKGGGCHNTAVNKRPCLSPALPPMEGASLGRTPAAWKGWHLSAREGTWQAQTSREGVKLCRGRRD